MNRWERKLWFQKNRGKIIKRSTIVLSVLLLVVGVIYITYSRFESTKEFTLINGKVVDSGDVKIISYEYDGSKQNEPPAKDSGYGLVNYECTNGAKATWDYINWGATVYDLSGKVKCDLIFGPVKSTTDLRIGDTINYSVTGNEGTISEWVVIKEGNEPELVAKNASPNKYTISNLNGYLRAVKNLNNEASSYGKNVSIIKSVRSMGYSNQIEDCANLSSCPSDTGYTVDEILVKDAMDNTLASNTDYWLASRYSNYLTDCNNYQGYIYYVNDSGVITYSTTIGSCGGVYTANHSIRPIITLQSVVKLIPTSTSNVYNLK